jgi:hypothetical protein
MVCLSSKNGGSGPRHKYPKRGRRFRFGIRTAAARAFAGAHHYLNAAGDLSLELAALMTGSSVAYVKAAITIIQSEDHELADRVLIGEAPVLATARALTRRAKLMDGFRQAAPEDLAAFGRTVGAGTIFDGIVIPAL